MATDFFIGEDAMRRPPTAALAAKNAVKTFPHDLLFLVGNLCACDLTGDIFFLAMRPRNKA
jgi:hypothetical protein